MVVVMNTSTKTSEQTRQKLLEATFAEIHRDGFQAASLTNILTATKLTKGALYYHFPDKKALGLAVIEEIMRPRLVDMIFTPLATVPHPLAALHDLLQAKLEEEDPVVVTLGCPLNNLMQEMSPLDEDFRLHLNSLFQEWVTTFAEALARGQAQGEMDAGLDAQETAFFLVSALEGCIGMSKNAQSLAAFRGCLRQLLRYLNTLKT